MSNKYILGMFIILSVFSYSQQDAQYTQYMYNTMSINPAYAGNRGVLNLLAMHRSQWVGLDGAPRTQTFSVHSPINSSRNVGLGISVIHDAIGPTDETYFDLQYSYTINTSSKGKLSFGIKGGLHLLNVNFNELSQFNSGDPLLQPNIDSRFTPNVGVGLYYHNSDKWYLGLSVPNLIETKHFKNSELSVANEQIHYYIIGGYVFQLDPNIKLKPTALLKATSGAPLGLDLSANALFNDKFRIGFGWRWDAAWSAMAGFQVSDQILIGLAYDKEITDLGNTSFNDGSYEVFLSFKLFKKYNNLMSPRFF